MTSCGPYALAKITGTPVKAIEVLIRKIAARYEGSDEHIILQDDGRVGLDPSAVELCLNELGFSVDWSQLDSQNHSLGEVAPMLSRYRPNLWAIAWIQGPDDFNAHVVAVKANRIWDIIAPGMIPEAHPCADMFVYAFGFVRRNHDNEQGLGEAA